MTIVCLLALTFFSIVIKTDKVYLSSSSFGNVINHVTKNVSNVDIDTSYFGNIFFTSIKPQNSLIDGIPAFADHGQEITLTLHNSSLDLLLQVAEIK